MAKKIFVPNQGTINADDLNRWENLRVDIFDEATTKDGARAAIAAAPTVHAHSQAAPSVGGIGGQAGFIPPPDLERLRMMSAYPSATTASADGLFAMPMITPGGDIVFMTITQLQEIFGGEGGGGPTQTAFDGGESETASYEAEIDGGESETTSFSTALDGGGA